MDKAIKTIDFIVPAYQEVANLEAAIQSILNSSISNKECAARIIVVDDGSTDGTAEIADQICRLHPEVRVVHQRNQGIGGAIHTGILHAVSDYLIIWPADMRMEQALYSQIVAHIGTADMLVGFRKERIGYSLLMKLNSAMFAAAVRSCCGVSFRDVTWISVYRRDLLSGVVLMEKGVAILPEMLLEALRRGANYHEIELEMQPRLHGAASAGRITTMIRALFGLGRICLRYNRFGL